MNTQFIFPERMEVFVWIDFGCINQDDDPAGELEQLYHIIEMSDCLFTPIVDPNPLWEYGKSKNTYAHYKAAAWSEGPHSYLQRAWCRVEMMFAANIPYDKEKWKKYTNYKRALEHNAVQRDARAHFLYGTKEVRDDAEPLTLEACKGEILEQFDPVKGDVTKESDKSKIRELVESLKLDRRVQQTYIGGRNDKGQKHGHGVWTGRCQLSF